MKVIFKNLEPSVLAREEAENRVGAVLAKFPNLIAHKISLTMSMDNSPLQPGPDLFEVTLRITGHKFKNVMLTKRDPSLYHALSLLCEAALERLNRSSDRVRVVSRASQRNSKSSLRQTEIESISNQ